jgi:phosphoketolase
MAYEEILKRRQEALDECQNRVRRAQALVRDRTNRIEKRLPDLKCELRQVAVAVRSFNRDRRKNRDVSYVENELEVSRLKQLVDEKNKLESSLAEARQKLGQYTHDYFKAKESLRAFPDDCQAWRFRSAVGDIVKRVFQKITKRFKQTKKDA